MSQRLDRELARHSTAARRHFALAGLLGLATAAAVVAQAALLAHVIAAAALAHATVTSLRGSLIALGGVFLARALLAGGFELSGRIGAGRVMADLRHRLLERRLVHDVSAQSGQATGELAAAAVQGVDALESYFAGYLPSLVLASTVPVAILIWVLGADLICAVILAVTVPVLITFMILIGRGANAATQRRWRTLSLLSAHFLDVVRGLETLRAHRREGAQAGILARVGERYRQETMATLRLAFLSALVLEACAMVGTALVAATIGVQLTGGHLHLAAGLTVLLLAPELYGPLRQVGQQFHASADGLAAAGCILAEVDAGASGNGSISSTTEHAPVATRLPDPRREAICFHDVRFSYPGTPSAVLDGINLTLDPGELVALIGASGAGKSTLANLALGLTHPTGGTVSCGGTDLRTVAGADWLTRCAWVPQRATIFAATMAQNIALSRPHAGPAEVSAAADAAGLGPLLGALPAGLDTPLGDGGRQLSAGQRQRVAMARAFLADAALVVLDEPTANLDPESADALSEVIVTLSAGRTTLLITHDHALAARADRTVALAGGRIAPAAGAVGRPAGACVLAVAV